MMATNNNKNDKSKKLKWITIFLLSGIVSLTFGMLSLLNCRNDCLQRYDIECYIDKDFYCCD